MPVITDKAGVSKGLEILLYSFSNLQAKSTSFEVPQNWPNGDFFLLQITTLLKEFVVPQGACLAFPTAVLLEYLHINKNISESLYLLQY